VPKVRLATACERAGLPMEAIAAAIRAGRLSFAFLEAAPFRRWAVRSARTYRQVSQETGVPLELLGRVLESMGFAPMAPDESIREDELEIVPLLQLGLATGAFDPAWLAGSAGPTPTACGSRAAGHLPPSGGAAVDRGAGGAHRGGTRTGRRAGAARADAGDVLVDLVGYTQLTEERGDAAAAELAETLAVLVDRSAREHGGVPVKWLGDGVMVHHKEPAEAVLSARELVAQLPEAGLPAALSGWRPGRWWSRAATTSAAP
jgi:hypothetical protein